LSQQKRKIQKYNIRAQSEAQFNPTDSAELVCLQRAAHRTQIGFIPIPVVAGFHCGRLSARRATFSEVPRHAPS
jgi:uncharacterized protein YgiB involved in biofilm formation